MKKYKVGIVGATGMVGQRFISLLDNHPWFDCTVLAASASSRGKTYAEAIGSRWALEEPTPEWALNMIVKDADADRKEIAESVDFLFCAVNMDKQAILQLEESYAKMECPVVSNNSANRMVNDIPMVIPEINPEHLQVIEYQKKRLNTSRGFIAVKSNCSIQSYVPALHPLKDVYGLEKVLACTYQAISGAGKTFQTWPEMVDNLIPYIGGEEEKSEKEPMKVWGKIENGVIVDAVAPLITTQCLRVPVSNGHTAAVFATFKNKPDLDEVKALWRDYKGIPQQLALPHAPKQFLNYFEEDNYPQAKLHRDLEGGMAVSIGRLREDSQYQIKFVSLSHNTLRGAAGGGMLLAELLCAQGYIEAR